MLSSSEFGFVIDAIDIEKLKYFNSDGSERETVMVWVESRADKRFWSVFLPDSDRYSFDLKIADEFVSEDGVVATGCKRLMALKNKKEIILGKHNIFCLDSDDDFLVSLYDPAIRAGHGHIYYTNIHSIDNAFLHPSHADRVLENLTACRLVSLKFKPSDLLNEFSSDVLEMVKLLSFSLKYMPDVGIPFRKELQCEMASLKTIEIDQPLSTSEIYQQFQTKISDLITNLQTEIEKSEKQRYTEFEKVVMGAGLNRSNAYLFIRGHDMFEMVVSIFERISKDLRGREVTRIKKAYAKPGDAINAVHKEWSEFGHSLKISFYTANLKIDFFCETLDSIQRDYG